jgi:hypothetical protein
MIKGDSAINNMVDMVRFGYCLEHLHQCQECHLPHGGVKEQACLLLLIHAIFPSSCQQQLGQSTKAPCGAATCACLVIYQYIL